MNTRRNFLKKSTTLTASLLLPTNFLSAILPAELPIPNFDGFLNANFIFHGNFDFTQIVGNVDIFDRIAYEYKIKNLQRKCFVVNPHSLVFNSLNEFIKLEHPQIETLGINPEDIYKVKSYYENNVVKYAYSYKKKLQVLPFEKWDELKRLPEYKNCEVEIPFEKMARILGKDDSSSPLQFFVFNSSDQWHDYFDVFLESKGIENFKNQTSKSLKNIRFNIYSAEDNIKFLQKVRERLQLNQQVATHCPEMITQINQLIKAIHVHVEDYKNFSNSNLQKKHFNQSDQDLDWYFDNTDIFAATKERFYE